MAENLKGTFVRCLGEGNDLFFVEDHTHGALCLTTMSGVAHGVESITKIKPASRADIESLRHWHTEMVKSIGELLKADEPTNQGETLRWVRWVCGECGETMGEGDWTYSDLAERGSPVCACDADMQHERQSTPKRESNE